MNINLIIKHAHSGVAYLAIIFLVIAIINAFAGLSAKREFTDKDKKFGLFALIFCHIQLLLGLILYYFFFQSVSPLIAEGGMGAVMKDSTLRQLLVEHPVINIIAIALITVGWSKHKKAVDSSAKFKKFTIFYTIGLILILSRIPWNQWFS
ncbi:hypothetical protein [Myroides sp. LJL119]